MITWGTPREVETRRRIRLAVWAFAYEFLDRPIVSDAVFDFECQMVDLNIRTDKPDMDLWFIINFDRSTGNWIHKHPDLRAVNALYHRHYQHGRILR